MRRILPCIVAALLVVAGNARADGVGGWSAFFGRIVRWDRIEGTMVMPDGAGMTVGPLQGSARYRVGGQGKVVLYLDSGYLFFRVDGLSWALHYQNGPLGSGLNGQFMGTAVCDSTERFGVAVWADTPVIELSQGAGAFAGILDLPQACRDRPDEIVFLLRHANPGNPNLYGTFVAYGAGRVIP